VTLQVQLKDHTSFVLNLVPFLFVLVLSFQSGSVKPLPEAALLRRIEVLHLELMLHRQPSPDKYQGSLSVALGQAERASKLSSAMQLVLEIERAKQTQPQRARLARAVEAALADFLPVAENAGVNVIQRRIRDCEVAVSVQALGTALLLLVDHLFSRAAAGDA
jgi:signal transduction histidine kinase